jgi:SAM-dependent MidA family methyltransferase
MPRNILPEPPTELKQLSAGLSARIRAEIEASGPMPFSRYMDLALYAPGLGYYSAGLHKLGASGDFVTAPELGGLFAACLARQVSQVASMLGIYDVLEVGAGSGKLAADLLRCLPRECSPAQYLILETSADLRRVQHDRIAAEAPGWLERVAWLDQPPSGAWRGVLLANEVVDALAAERFRVSAGEIEQMCVTLQGSALEWDLRPAPADLATAVRHIESSLGRPFPDGYRSEVRPQLAAWLDAMTGSLQQGLALVIDYGYPRREYYLPERSDGTLMCTTRYFSGLASRTSRPG